MLTSLEKVTDKGKLSRCARVSGAESIAEGDTLEGWGEPKEHITDQDHEERADERVTSNATFSGDSPLQSRPFDRISGHRMWLILIQGNGGALK